MEISKRRLRNLSIDLIEESKYLLRLSWNKPDRLQLWIAGKLGELSVLKELIENSRVICGKTKLFKRLRRIGKSLSVYGRLIKAEGYI